MSERVEPSGSEAGAAAESRAPTVLLAAFAAIVLIAVVAVPRDEPPGRNGEGPASKAHGPAEFQDILGVDPLAGLEGSSADFPVPPPPFSAGIYPCAKCHDPVENEAEIAELKSGYEEFEEEEEIDPEMPLHLQKKVVLHHGSEERWCFDCHNPYDRNTLRLANGTAVAFEESFRLCAQCHGTIFRDWKAGVHGRRSGFWNGKKRYLLCAHCHDPHAPAFKPIRPLPPPVDPAYLNESDR